MVLVLVNKKVNRLNRSHFKKQRRQCFLWQSVSRSLIKLLWSKCISLFRGFKISTEVGPQVQKRKWREMKKVVAEVIFLLWNTLIYVYEELYLDPFIWSIFWTSALYLYITSNLFKKLPLVLQIQIASPHLLICFLFHPSHHLVRRKWWQ